MAQINIKTSDFLPKDQSDQIDDQFICICCTNVVYQPIECETCQKWFCTQCIVRWHKEGAQTCPNCRQIFKSSSKLHMYLKNLLDTYQF